MKKARRSRFPTRFQRSQPVRRSATRKQPGVDYNRLEARQMLATDLGLNLTGSTFGTQSTVQNPNMVGDVGTTHSIELIRDKISVFNKQSGVRELYRTQTQFWIEIGATVGADTITNAQVVFDRFANRWMLLGEGSGAGNWLYLAISNGPNPSNPATGWRALRFVGDSVGVRHCGDLTIGMDADALLITTRNTSNVTGFTNPSISVFTIPKVDLYAANPTVTNMSRFESLPRAVYGDYVRAASSFEASDGRATFVGNLSNGAETTRFDVVGVAAAAATITMPTKIIFGFDPFNPTLNLGSAALGWGSAPNARQVSATDITIDMDSPVIFSQAVDVNGSLWLAQSVLVPYTAGEAAGIVYYEVTKSGYDSLGPTPDYGGPPTISLPGNTMIHVGLIGMPTGDIRGPLPHEWDLWNPSIAVNEFGVVAISYTISSEEYEVFPTAASSIGVTVNGQSLYIPPPIDDITWIERNTQFEAPVFIQPGLGVFENNGINPSTWSYRASTNFDPSNVNRFWANIQWANTVNRWSTSVAELRPNRFVVEITANDLNNNIVVRRNAANNDLLEIEMDGIVTDLLPYEVVGRVIINGFNGADHYLLDYSNGNPVPVDGFVFDGMRGPDTVETNNPDGSRFVVDEPSAGTYNEVSRFQNVENLHGGPGNDSFTVTDNPLLGTVGFLAGSLVGNGGDDLFHFGGTGGAMIGDSVLGGIGFNTLSFETRLTDTEMTLLGYGGFTGYEGRTVGGPIGGDQATDRFYDINYIRGSDTDFDTVNGLDVLTNVFVDDEASIYETGGINLGFFEVNAINMSSFHDRVVGVRNTVNPLQLNGLGGDDDYYFSSDGDGLMGSTAPLQGLLFAQGGAGLNEMWISNRGGTANTAGLILLNRVAGIGEIAYNAIGGRFDLTVWTSEFADHVDLHSFIETNTLELFLLGGNDRVSIQDLSKAFIKVYGGVGDDVYAIEKVQGIDLRNLELLDSINAERDRVTLVGTLLDEVWVIDTTTFFDLNVVYVGIELFGIEGRAGIDTFYIRSANVELFLDGEEGNDIFVFSSDAPGTTGGVNGIIRRVTIEGGTGQNRLTVSARDSGSSKNTTVFSDRIEGLLPDTLFYAATGGSFSLPGQVGGIHLIGSEAGNDVFTVLGLDLIHTLRIDGVGGNDYFVVRPGALGNILLNGGSGDDRNEISLIGSGSRQVFVNDSGGGDDRLFVLGTAIADIFSIDTGAVRRASEAILRQSALVYAKVEGLDGTDQFNVNGGVATNLHLYGGNQNDIFTVTSTSGVTGLLVSGDAGNDLLTYSAGLATTFSQIFGGADNDNLVIQTNVLGNMTVDGGTGSDIVNTTVASSGGRFLDARDSGGTTGDHLLVNGNALSNLLVVRETQIEFGAQRTIYDVATERMTINGLDGIDLIDIHGSSAAVTRVNGGNGNDQITVISTNLAPQITLDGQAGDDVFTIRRTLAGSRITALGNSGDDLFNIGSTATEDNGDLNTIQGIVSITAGTNGTAGQDRLYANDRGVGAAYSYYFGPTGIRTIPGPLAVARPLFVGINYDSSLELARLDGTQFANFFSVIPSQFTTYYIDGNLPNPVVQNGDQIFLQTTPGDGHILHITSPSLGSGYWDFTNGTKEVRFENIELLFSKNIGSPGPMAMRSSGGSWGNSGGSGGGNYMRTPGSGGNGGNANTSGNPVDQLMGSVGRQNGTRNDSTWGNQNRFRIVPPGVADQVFNSDVRVVLGMI